MTALASIFCEVMDSTLTGTHRVSIGTIADVHLLKGEALIYAQSRFHRLQAVA